MKKKSVIVSVLSMETVHIPIVGISPLIVHRFDPNKILPPPPDIKPMGQIKPERDPEYDFTNSKHISNDGWEGFPVAGFKGAIIRGAKLCGLVMKDVQMSVFIEPDCEITQLVEIKGEATLRTDVVRLSNGAPDIRFRPEYRQWNAVLKVRFNKGMIKVDHVYSVIEAAGGSVGIGEMRPEKGKYNYGRFKLVK